MLVCLGRQVFTDETIVLYVRALSCKVCRNQPINARFALIKFIGI